MILIDGGLFHEDESREERIDVLRKCTLRVLAHLHYHLKMRWCFRVVEKDRGSYNHIQLLDFDRDSMKGFEALLREKSNETSHEISSGSDVSPQSNSPMTLKTLCRSISSVLEHIDAARLDPLLSAQRKVSNRDRKSSGLASNVQTAIFLFGDVPTIDSEFCGGEQQKDYKKYVSNQIRRLGFRGRKLDTVSLSWIDLNSQSITSESSSLTLNGAVIPSNVLLDRTFCTFPVSSILRHYTKSTTASAHEIYNVDMYIGSQKCSASMTRVVTTSTSTCPYEDVKGVELRLEGWIRSKDVPSAMMRLELNETNTYALAMSSSMERVREFMRKSKRCGILDIVTILKNGTRNVRGGILLAMNTSLLIRDVRIRAKSQKKKKTKEKLSATTLTEIWSSSLSELPFPQSTLKEQSLKEQSEQEDSDLVQKCEDWVRDQTKKMEEDSLLSKELNILTSSNNSQSQSNFDTTTSRKMSLDEAKEMLKTRYEMFTTQTIKADASTFVTQDLYNTEARLENPAQLRDWLRETMLLDTTELSKKHPGIFIAGSDVVEQTLREYEMQMMLTLELSLPCGHWKKNTELKIKDPVQKSTKKRLKRLIGRMSLIMNTSKEQSKSVSFYLESELVRMYIFFLVYHISY